MLKGITFLETIVTVALTSVIMLALSGMIWYFYRTNAYTLEQTQAVNSARVSLEHAVHDLREASYGADGAYPLLSAATSTVTFYADPDNNGTVDKIRYYLSGTTLYRGSTTPGGNPPSYVGQSEITTLVVDNIRNTVTTPLFTYADANGSLLSTSINVANVASIHIAVYTDVDPNRSPIVYMLSGSATLRNVRNMSSQ